MYYLRTLFGTLFIIFSTLALAETHSNVGPQPSRAEPAAPTFVDAEISANVFSDTLYRALRFAAKNKWTGVTDDGNDSFTLEVASRGDLQKERIRCQGVSAGEARCTFHVKQAGKVRDGAGPGKGMAKSLYYVLLNGYVSDYKTLGVPRTYELQVTNPRLDNGRPNNFLFNNDGLQLSVFNLAEWRKTVPSITCSTKGIVNPLFTCTYELTKP